MIPVIISGANGFIGKAMFRKLFEKNYIVTKLPRRLLYHPRELKKFVNKIKPKQVFHFAAYGNKYDQLDIEMTIKANVLGTFNLLEATREIDYEFFINTGSSSEYGVKEKPMKENDSLNPSTVYGMSKAAATLISHFYAKTYRKPVVTIRPFSVYGPGDERSHFIPRIIHCLKTGNELTLSPGVHDWIFIDDFIEGCLTVAKNHKKLDGDIVNIGTGNQTNNKEIVELLCKITGLRIKVKKIENLRNYDTIKSWVADNSRLKSLGWQPTVSIEEGLKKTFDNYEE